MNWLITGGCGFIGVNLIARLLREGGEPAAIRVLDNLSASTREDLGGVCAFHETPAPAVGPFGQGGVELVVGDIRDADLALRAAYGADVIVHLAACTGVLPSVEDPRTDCETNVLGVLNYLEAARHSDRKPVFILASSGAPLGEQTPPIHEEKVPKPVSPYGASKLCGEAYCHAYRGSYGLRTIALRFGNVYGPRSGHKQSVVAKFIKLALDGQPWVIYGDGAQTRDFIFVEDLVEAILKAASAGVGGEIFQIATHRETTVGELADALARLLTERLGRTPEIRKSDPLPGEVRRNFSDISKARRVLGWEPRVALEDGLRRTVDWFLAGQKQ